MNWDAIRAVIRKDLTAVRRAKWVIRPMIGLPIVLLVLVPAGIALYARARPNVDVERALSALPGALARPVLSLPQPEQLLVLTNVYLLAPLPLIVPLMVSAVLAADAFAGEKERKTLESALYLPISDRDLFMAKVIGAFLPAVTLTWAGFACFSLVADLVGWTVMHRFFMPTRRWLLVIGWVAPAVAALGLGVMVRVSARVQTTQEANQLGATIVLPLIFIAVGQASVLLLAPLGVTVGVGALFWVVALLLVRGGARRFTRDQLATKL